jgi:hypothetical protein
LDHWFEHEPAPKKARSKPKRSKSISSA